MSNFRHLARIRRLGVVPCRAMTSEPLSAAARPSVRRPTNLARATGLLVAAQGPWLIGVLAGRPSTAGATSAVQYAVIVGVFAALGWAVAGGRSWALLLTLAAEGVALVAAPGGLDSTASVLNLGFTLSLIALAVACLVRPAMARPSPAPVVQTARQTPAQPRARPRDLRPIAAVLVLGHGVWLSFVALETGLITRLLTSLMTWAWNSADWALVVVPMVTLIALLAGWSMLALAIAGGRRAALVLALLAQLGACVLAMLDVADPMAAVAVATSAAMAGFLVQVLRRAPATAASAPAAP
jgi:hypothetical protein